MSFVPLFLQVRAATPTPPSDAGSTPPAPADAGSTLRSDASPDASADAARDASVSPDAGATSDASAADAGTATSSPPPAADASAPRDAGASSSSPDASIVVDPSFYVAAGACYAGRGFGNSRDDYHDGACFQLTAGFPTIRFNQNFYLRPEFRFQQEWANHVYHPNHGDPITSSASISDLNGLLTLGWQPIPYFAVEASFLFGASYFDSHAPESGEGGTFVSNLALGVSLHNWGFNYGGVLRLLVPEQALMDGFALGGGIEASVSHTDLSVTPDWSDRNPNDPAVAVGSTSVSVGAFLRVRFGGPSGSSSRAASSGSSGPDRSGSSTASSTPPPSTTGGSGVSGTSSESPASSRGGASSSSPVSSDSSTTARSSTPLRGGGGRSGRRHRREVAHQ